MLSQRKSCCPSNNVLLTGNKHASTTRLVRPAAVGSSANPLQGLLAIFQSRVKLMNRAEQQQQREKELLQLVAGSRFGAVASQEQAEAVLSLVEDFSSSSTSSTRQGVERLGGSWTLLYTSEKSVHDIVRTLPTKDISQEINFSAMRVTNCIEFSGPGKSALRASAPMKVVNSNRIAYAFDKIDLTLLGISVTLPFPFKAGGWTEAVYCTDTMRIMQNSRGDTLVFGRDVDVDVSV